ncbi:hypothetical protein GPJ59_10490 [Streptomyces bambusae]|uniref:HEAT repeat domain-containing protein n=1 Tax=Streptomyces bambusae TaxID=1550616 RepID=A0ABS6Z3H4_9ACTN|nr:hypothetical protein [Streptomyces bambusae]
MRDVEKAGLVQRFAGAVVGLESCEIATCIRSVEELARCVAELVDRVADVAVQDEDVRFLVFERIGRFGSLAVPAVERVYREAQDADLRLMSASVLLDMGSSVGVPDLMEALGERGQPLYTGALSLSAAGIEAAAGPIERALLATDPTDTATIDCLTLALCNLGGRVSPAVIEHVSAVEPDWRRNAFLKGLVADERDAASTEGDGS